MCNAGPPIVLAGIGLAEILRDFFGEVLVAEAVQMEVEAGRGKGAGAGAGILKTAGWLRVKPFRQPPDPLLVSLMDSGEAATFKLARQESAGLGLIDEVKGRRVAGNVFGLAIIGTRRSLAEAKQASLISHICPLLERIRRNGYWIADQIFAGIHAAGWGVTAVGSWTFPCL